MTVSRTDRKRADIGAPPPVEMAEQRVWIPSACGRLEAVLDYREELTPREAVLALSPHPRFGGDLANNVNEAVARRLAARGYPTLRLNYRGIGESEAPFEGPMESFRYWSELIEGEGVDDVLEDVRAGLRWLGRTATAIHLFGYSFGAMLALRAATAGCSDTRLASVIAVALAVGEYRLDDLGDIAVPVLAVHSDDDFATPLETLRETLRPVRDSELVVLPDTDHFFRGRENEVASLAGDFLERVGKPAGTGEGDG